MNAYRVVAPAKNEIALEEFTLPDLAPNEVLLETLYTTISPGTELAWLQHQPSTAGIYPWYPGYSGTARVLQIGKGVKALELGQPVACNMPHSSHVVTLEHKCHPIKTDPLEASAFRLASIALQGIRRAQIQLGDSVCVLGLGPIGNLAAQFARLAGAVHVTGVDLLDYRQALALECGTNVTSVSAEEAFDVVIEATGLSSVIQSAFTLAKQRGKVILLGSPRGLTNGVNFYTDVHRKGISIIGAHELNRSPHDDLLEEVDLRDENLALDFLASNRIRLRPLITDIMPAKKAPRAYKRLAKREEELVLISLDWQAA